MDKVTIRRHSGYDSLITIQQDGYIGIQVETPYFEYLQTDSYAWLIQNYSVSVVESLDDPPPNRPNPPPTKPDHLKIKKL